MPETTTPSQLASHILQEVETVIREAEEGNKPLEVEPFRSRLFELFVTADGAGYTHEDSDPDLSTDGLCQQLAASWGLRDAALQSVTEKSQFPAEQLQKMRSLWSVMRMWMEWTYAWSRWDEFHRDPQ